MSAHEDHPHYHAHHFHTMEQQNASAKLGMWAFLVQELLFFSGLFMAYISMRFFYPETFEMVQQKKLAQHSVGSNQHTCSSDKFSHNGTCCSSSTDVAIGEE